MARKRRLHVPGGIYHVMLRENGGQGIFFAKADRKRFLELLAKPRSSGALWRAITLHYRDCASLLAGGIRIPASGAPAPRRFRGMIKQAAFFALVVITAVLAFSPVVQTGQVIHILFDFDLLLLIFTGESDPTVLTTRHIDWYPNVGALRIIVSVALACLALYMVWKVGDADPALGSTEAGRRAKRVVQGGDLEVLDGPDEAVAPATAEILEPARLLQDHTRPADVLSSAEAEGDIVEIEHEPSDHFRRRDRGAGGLHEAE